MTEPPPRAGLTLFVVSAAILFDALDLSITQVGLPSIQRDLRIGAGSLQWVAGAYVLTYGGLLLLGGRLADLIGRRRVFVSGLLLFAVMSLVCGLAPSGGVLIVARGLQGVGAALTVPAAVSIIAMTFAEGANRNRALGVFGACASAGFALGLVMGGVVTELLDWRWIFLIKVPPVLGVAMLAMRVVGEGRAGERTRSYDLAGALLSAAGLLLLVFAITQFAESTVGPAVVVGAVVLAVLLLAGFVAWERRAPDPLLPLEFFRSRIPRTADLASLAVLAAPFGFSYVATLYLQTVQDRTALETGLALLPGAVLSGFVSRFAAPSLIARLGLRASAVGSLLVVAAGFAILVGMNADSSYVTLMLPATVVCLGLGMGVAYPVFTIAAVTGVEDDRQGLAAGIQSTALQVGGGIGLAVISAVVAAGFGNAADAAAQLDALRRGAAIGAALPLLGAVVAFVGFRAISPADRAQEPAPEGARV